MSTLAQLSVASAAALRNAEDKGAHEAAHFLRVQIHELFREARHAKAGHRCADCEFNPTPATGATTDRFHNGG